MPADGIRAAGLPLGFRHVPPQLAGRIHQAAERAEGGADRGAACQISGTNLQRTRLASSA
jgi:hypothetical protein